MLFQLQEVELESLVNKCKPHVQIDRQILGRRSGPLGNCSRKKFPLSRYTRQSRVGYASFVSGQQISGIRYPTFYMPCTLQDMS